MPGDARRAGRIALACPAAVTLLDHSCVDALALDLSPGGVCLRTAAALGLAQLCAVRFEIEVGGAARPVVAIGQVIYCAREPDGAYRCGIEFVRVEPEGVAAITALLQRK